MDLKELSTKEKIPDELFEELLALENQMLTEMDLDDVEQLSLIYKFLVEYYAINEDDPKYQYYIYKLQDLLINKSNIKSLQRRRTRKTLKKNQNETQNPESKPSSQSQSELPQQEDKEIKSQRRRTTIKKKLNESKANPMKIREYIKNSDLSYNSGVRMLENSVRTQKNKFLQNYQLKKMKIYNYKSQQIVIIIT